MKYNIKDLREQYHVSRKEFCELTKIPYRTLQNWELEERECPYYVYNLVKCYLKERDKDIKQLLAGSFINEKHNVSWKWKQKGNHLLVCFKYRGKAFINKPKIIVKIGDANNIIIIGNMIVEEEIRKYEFERSYLE